MQIKLNKYLKLQAMLPTLKWVEEVYYEPVKTDQDGD